LNELLLAVILLLVYRAKPLCRTSRPGPYHYTSVFGAEQINNEGDLFRSAVGQINPGNVAGMRPGRVAAAQPTGQRLRK
jgi:hypothetical protein